MIRAHVQGIPDEVPSEWQLINLSKGRLQNGAEQVMFSPRHSIF